MFKKGQKAVEGQPFHGKTRYKKKATIRGKKCHYKKEATIRGKKWRQIGVLRLISASCFHDKLWLCSPCFHRNTLWVPSGFRGRITCDWLLIWRVSGDAMSLHQRRLSIDRLWVLETAHHNTLVDIASIKIEINICEMIHILNCGY